ncbi:MAG: TAXI family TRAP transporter solute-binding subunit, partial [Dehalococcoidia bacterium]
NANVPFKEPYDGARMVAGFTWAIISMWTTDPSIKTFADLKGKSAHLGPKGATPGKLTTKMMEVAGFLDQVRVSYGTFGQMADALNDGLVDATVVTGGGYIGTGVAPSPYTLPVHGARKPTYIRISQEEVKRATDAMRYTGIRYYPNLPAGSLFDDQPEISAWTHDMGWWADKSMDEEITYELAKIIVENAGKFGSYHKAGSFMTRENVPRASVPKELFHLGALRYYQEQNIPVGLEALR